MKLTRREGRGIGRVLGDDLVVTVPAWLAAQLGIAEGSMVATDNAGGKFNLKLAAQDLRDGA